MFWDAVSGIYSLFEKAYNGKVNRAAGKAVAAEICSTDDVLECACGTGLLTTAIAPCCKSLIATDFSVGMLRQTERRVSRCGNVKLIRANIMRLQCRKNRFDKVVAGNVIHLLDDPQAALRELSRVCKPDGKLIIPTYINDNGSGKTGFLIRVISKSGADFKQQFTLERYRQFFRDAGFPDAEITLISGRVPCAVAVLRNHKTA
ncbi:MAG TPA: SAM-dependent methyltransferase [Ruminococcus sp.]|nr:SAM-dependent methyltransferase [Ruminococcus sp.]